MHCTVEHSSRQWNMVADLMITQTRHDTPKATLKILHGRPYHHHAHKIQFTTTYSTMSPDPVKLRKHCNAIVTKVALPKYQSRILENTTPETTEKNNPAPALGTTLVTKTTLAAYEVSIDGLIYDIRGFKHPGGNNIIELFAGKDVTVEYRMNHHHHTTDKHLRKMKLVGKVANYTSE